MTSNRRLCFACDLSDDPELIKRYEEFHRPGKVWPEVLRSLRSSGILDMEIYITGNRLFMIMEVDQKFSMERKNDLDEKNPAVDRWEKQMWTYQKALPWAEPGQKWVAARKIFNLSDHAF